MVNRNGPWTKSTKLIIDKSNLGSGQGGEGEEEKEEGRGGEERGQCDKRDNFFIVFQLHTPLATTNPLPLLLVFVRWCSQ